MRRWSVCMIESMSAHSRKWICQVLEAAEFKITPGRILCLLLEAVNVFEGLEKVYRFDG